MLPRREYSVPASLLPCRTCIPVNEFVSYSGYNATKFSSPGKESACNVGDPSLIPELWRSPGEGIGYWLQYSWASPVAQLVKNLPIVRETWVQSLGWADPLEKGTTTHSSILAWRIPWTEESGRLQSMELQSQTQLSEFYFYFQGTGIRERAEKVHLWADWATRCHRTGL